MKTAILGGAALALLAGDCFAQDLLNTFSGSAPSASTRSAYTAPTKTVARPPVAGAAPVTTSKITFHSRPAGAKITLPDGKSCTAPCSLTVGFNEKFTAVATKHGYRSKEIEVAPQVTDRGKAQIIGAAIGAGVVGLVVGAAMADRAYGPEPFVVELVPGEGGPVAASSARQATSGTATSRQEAAARKASARATQAKISCSPQGCVEVKAGCSVAETQNISSSSALGGGGASVVCR